MFYQKHLGEALNNQLWLVTHSDAILREATRSPRYAVYHMEPQSGSRPASNQLKPLNSNSSIDLTLASLVGDLATYNPGSAVVLLEGEESETDAAIITSLFPIFSEQVNLVSVGPKRRVTDLYETLEMLAEKAKLDARFYAIVDRDLEKSGFVPSPRQFSWNVYHIENYLLETEFVLAAHEALQLKRGGTSLEQIEQLIRQSAVESVG